MKKATGPIRIAVAGRQIVTRRDARVEGFFDLLLRFHCFACDDKA